MIGLTNRMTLHYPGKYVRPGEIELDGLIGTPDLFDVHDERVLEVKMTKLSSRHEIDSQKLWKYWVQLKAYCYMFETPKGELHIGYLNGDYRDVSYDYRVWQDEFTRQDLMMNWRMLLNESNRLVKERDRAGR